MVTWRKGIINEQVAIFMPIARIDRKFFDNGLLICNSADGYNTFIAPLNIADENFFKLLCSFMKHMKYPNGKQSQERVD